MGYDAFLGNPHTNEMDPGFRRPVIDLTYAKVSPVFTVLNAIKCTRGHSNDMRHS